MGWEKDFKGEHSLMGKLPFMQFYPGDWIRDTQTVNHQTKGAWIDLLCQMWIAPEVGVLHWNFRQFTTFLRLAYDEPTEEMVTDLSRVADIELQDSGGNSIESPLKAAWIIIKSRRMIRDWAALQAGKDKHKRYNDLRTTRKRPSNDQKTTTRSQKSEVRSHTSEEDLKREDPVDNSKTGVKDLEALGAACAKVCAADRQRFAAGPTEIIRWQHRGLEALERTESREAAVGVILETLTELEKALKAGKVQGDWRDYAEAIRKRVRTTWLTREADAHKTYDPKSVGGILDKMKTRTQG